MKSVFLLIVFAILVTYVVALEEEKSSKQGGAFVDETNGGDDDDEDYDDDYDYALQDKKGHKHKHKHKLFFLGGGLKSLAAFIAIKIKIILIVITVIGVIGFTLKVFGALKYAGYIGGNDCPVIHEPAYGLGYSATPPSDHSQEYGNWDDSSGWSKNGYARSLVGKYMDTSFISHALNNMDMAEMIFSALEMDDDQCRRRLVCEIDAKTREFPILNYAMEFFSHGFEKYRSTNEIKYKECAKLYSACKDNKESRRRKRFAKKK